MTLHTLYMQLCVEEQTAGSLSGDQLGGESNDPTLGLTSYLSTLLKNVEEDIDFDHMESLIDKGADVNAVCSKLVVGEDY